MDVISGTRCVPVLAILQYLRHLASAVVRLIRHLAFGPSESTALVDALFCSFLFSKLNSIRSLIATFVLHVSPASYVQIEIRVL